MKASFDIYKSSHTLRARYDVTRLLNIMGVCLGFDLSLITANIAMHLSLAAWECTAGYGPDYCTVEVILNKFIGGYGL